MESPCYQLLAASAPLLALVPKARIFKDGYAGDAPLTPYILIENVTGEPQNALGEAPGIDDFRDAVKVVADDSAQCKAIARAVRDTLQEHAHCQLAMGPFWDFEIKKRYHTSDWRFWTPR